MLKLEAKPNNRRRQDDKNKIKRQAIAIGGFVVFTVGLAWFFESQATTTVLFVRHADRLQGGADDPGLSPVGRRRAALLADVLADVDVVASVDAIYATQFKRTQQTAAPLAERLGLPVNVADADGGIELANEILREHKGEIVLVIAHSNTIAPMIEELQGSKRLPDWPEDDYDELYIVTIPWFGKVKTLRLHYGLFLNGAN